MGEIQEALYEVALNKLKKTLIKDGFHVEVDKVIYLDNHVYNIDLFAVKGEERRIHELKIGKNKIQKGQFQLLKNVANYLNASLFVTYLETPRSKEIEYCNIENIICSYLLDNIPDEISELATHIYIDEVDSVDIDSIKIEDNKEEIEGTGILYVLLQYGSGGDLKNGYGDKSTDSFEFNFRIELVDKEIVKAYFRFDLKHFYE